MQPAKSPPIRLTSSNDGPGKQNRPLSAKTGLQTTSVIRAFTLVELLVVILIIAILAALLFPAITGMTKKGRTAKSVSQLGQIYGAISQHVVDNEGNFPYAYGSPSDKPPGLNDKQRNYWYDVVKARLYPHPGGNAQLSRLDGPSGWGPPSLTDTTGTVLRSPNAEKSWPKSVISYGYNDRFIYRPGTSQKLALIYNNSQTVLLGDNLGNTHALTPDKATSFGKLNPRNGASQDFATNGVAIVVFIDGHTELLSASEATALNEDKTNIFWGVAP